MPSKISVGCCVDALVGPFYALEEGNKRRKRARLSGIVIASAPDGKWKVFWSNVGKVSLVSGRTLRFLKKADGTSMRNMDISTLLEKEFVGEQAGLDAWFLTKAGGLLTGLGPDNDNDVAARDGGGGEDGSNVFLRNNLCTGGLLIATDSRERAPASPESGRINAPADSHRVAAAAIADGPGPGLNIGGGLLHLNVAGSNRIKAPVAPFASAGDNAGGTNPPTASVSIAGDDGNINAALLLYLVDCWVLLTAGLIPLLLLL